MSSTFFNKNPVLSWALIAGGIALVAGGVYFAYDASKMMPPSQVASDSSEAAQPAPGQETNTQEEIADSTATEEETADASGMALPRFDVLRVEPDGSTVVAGTAPGAKTIELIANGTVIATTGVSENGDFVFALDNPLSPGAYELMLRALAEDGTVILSRETGIVNVPESGGELLAMVDSEGKAPRILQKPDAGASPEAASESASTDQKAQGETQTATAAPPAEPEAEAEPSQDAAAPAEGSEQETIETARVETAPAGAESQEAATEPAATDQAEQVMVQAVDVEGDRLFIAGSGVPGRSVNLYIDGEYLGTATVGNEKSFLLETQKALSNGEYEIRADMLGNDGATVDRRAAVRLVHDIGERPAADTTTVVSSGASGGGAATGTQTAQAPGSAASSQNTDSGEVAREAGTEGTTVIARNKTDATAGAPASSQAGTGSDGAEVATAPKSGSESVSGESEPLQAEILPIVRTGDSVIIRKGDNLWRISRRMLGQGLHYTVIYNANQHQIRNPHLIYPGQIFDVPATVPRVGSG